MPSSNGAPISGAQVTLDREYLQIRAWLLQIASSMDRINRGDGEVSSDPRLAQIAKSLEVLKSKTSDRSEQIQKIFSLPYDEHWREEFGI